MTNSLKTQKTLEANV